MTRLVWQPTGQTVAWRPTALHTIALASPARELLMGGAVGGGKSEYLMIDPLRYVAHPKHRSILFRREKEDSREVIDRSRELYARLSRHIQWVESRMRFEFPTGAFHAIGYAENEKDIEDQKTKEFNWIGFDEATTFTGYMYTYMFSRNRAKDRALPLRMRGGTNPDGVGHEFFFSRLVKGRDPFVIYRDMVEIETPGGKSTVPVTQQFIPATVFDNPYINDRDAYIAGMMSMGKQLADALIYGKWDYFRGQMFPYGPTGGLVTVEPVLKSRTHFVVRALDYGWNDPTVIQWWIVYPHLEADLVIELADELVVTETSIKNVALMVERREAEMKKMGVVLPPTFSVADPSVKRREGTSGGQSILDLLSTNGLWFEKATNDRMAGWAQCRTFLESGRARVWKGRGQHLQATLGKLIRDPKKADDILPRQNDHPADTFRYAALCVVENLGQVAPPPREPKVGQDPYFDQIIAALRKGGPTDSMEGLGDGF